MESSSSTIPSVCGICGGRAEPRVMGAERMFGMGGSYRYDLCVACGCLQLRDMPTNMDPFYASGYYAFADPSPPSASRRVYRRLRDAILFGRARVIRPLLARFMPRQVTESGEWIARAHAGPQSRILDVGCGAGIFLRRLADAGYAHASGVDPFIPGDIEYRGRVLVRHATLAQIDGQFDLIMFHHSLEHIGDQIGTMAAVGRLLAPGGMCLVRVPTVSSQAWEEYEDRWVQLDAPRHFFLHSRKSMDRLARDSGMEVVVVIDDSTRFQFEGSELYRRDIPLREIAEHPSPRLQRLKYSARARRLNARHRGDQAAFYLRKV